LTDYEMMWGFLLRDYWLPKMQLNAREKQEQADMEFQGVLNEIARDGRHVFETVAKLMEQTTKHLHRWRCDDPGIPRGIERSKIDKAYQELDQALMEVPHPNAICARLLLCVAVIVYVIPALARWSWLCRFLATWLKDFFPFVEPWHIPVLIGAMGFLVFVWVVMGGLNIWKRAPEKVEKARDRVLGAIHREISSLLRELGLQLLQSIQQNFLGRTKEITEINRDAREGIERLRENWKATAKAFAAGENPMTSAVVRSWSELEPVIDERLKGQDWSDIWQQVLEGAGIQTFSEWCNRIKDGTAEVKIAEAAKVIWRKRLQGDEMRRLSFYLKPHENEVKVRDELKRRYEQARAFLWPHASEGLQWQLHAEGEDILNSMVEQTVHTLYGDNYTHQWQKLTLPAIAGFLRLGRIEVTEKHER
jgi:hypothetical protein